MINIVHHTKRKWSPLKGPPYVFLIKASGRTKPLDSVFYNI
ncbi:hypothetical protein [Gottfriedia acidiceleris]|nr:hypothetical protein [Gottfriedia acidiceleris]